MAMVQCPECNGEISSKAYTCPHCGYPIKTPETNQYEYILSTGTGQTSGISGLLRVLAFLTWIGGIIIAISGANVVDSVYSSHFSFVAFLTILIPYAIYGIIMYGMATLADQIANTSSIVSGLVLTKKTKTNPSTTPVNRSSYKPSSGVVSGDWTCPVCRTVNHSWDEVCTHCSEPKRKQ